MTRLYREIRDYHSALVTLVDVNIRTTVATNRLGWIWWIINPLVTMGIYYLFIQVIFERGGDRYYLFILAGLVAWQGFSGALGGTINIIINNAQLIRQVALPISMLLAIPIMVQIFFNSIGIVIILAWNFQAVGIHSLAVIPLLILIGLIVYGLGLFLSVINVYVNDTQEIISYVLRAGFFLSPVLFPSSRVFDSPNLPEFAKTIFALNPMNWIITSFREVLLDGQLFSWNEYFLKLFISLIIIQVGLFWLRANSSQIVKML